jgi:CxxC motif-containing protein
MTAEISDDIVEVCGNACPRGKDYAINECLHPVRTVTSSVRLKNREDMMVSVKTKAPINKEDIYNLMEIIRKTEISAPVDKGDIIIKDIFGTDIIATKTVK